MAKWSKSKLRGAAAELKKHGRGGDTDVVHVNSDEKRMLKRYGGSGKTNPKTGLKEYAPDGSAFGGFAGNRLGHEIGRATKGDDTNQTTTVPTASKAPAGKEPLGPGGSLAAASANESLGDQGDAAAAASMGAKPMSHYAPGDVPAVKGADAIGIGATIGGGATLGALRALSTAAGEGDPLADHMGKQVGWSSGGDETGGRPGKGGASAATSGAKAAGASGATSSSSSGSTTSSSTSGSAAGSTVGPDGQTLTVNPDGTVRTSDTSVAGLRAQRRYGAKTAAG